MPLLHPITASPRHPHRKGPERVTTESGAPRRRKTWLRCPLPPMTLRGRPIDNIHRLWCHPLPPANFTTGVLCLREIQSPRGKGRDNGNCQENGAGQIGILRPRSARVDIDSCVRTRQAVAEELEIPAGWDGTRRARQAVQPRAKLVWR